MGINSGEEASQQHPIVLLTDQTELRQQANNGELKPWVSPNVVPVHFGLKDNIGNTPGSQHDEYQAMLAKSMVDFGVLARAKCVIRTLSGFSLQVRRRVLVHAKVRK